MSSYLSLLLDCCVCISVYPYVRTQGMSSTFNNWLKFLNTSRWIDRWMQCDFMSFSTVFQSYLDDERLIMIVLLDCCVCISVYPYVRTQGMSSTFNNWLKFPNTSRWMDRWMQCDFMSFSTVFQSYLDDERLIMIVCNRSYYGFASSRDSKLLDQQASA